MVALPKGRYNELLIQEKYVVDSKLYTQLYLPACRAIGVFPNLELLEISTGSFPDEELTFDG